MQITSNLSSNCPHGRFSLLWRWCLTPTCLPISTAEANSGRWCKIIIGRSTYLTKFMVISPVHTVYQRAPIMSVRGIPFTLWQLSKNAVVIVLFTSDIWRSLIALIKNFLCQLGNATRFGSPLLPGLQWHPRSQLFQGCAAKSVMAMKMIIECHHRVEERIRLPHRVDLASEWKTPHCLSSFWASPSTCTCAVFFQVMTRATSTTHSWAIPGDMMLLPHFRYFFP